MSDTWKRTKFIMVEQAQLDKTQAILWSPSMCMHRIGNWLMPLNWQKNRQVSSNEVTKSAIETQIWQQYAAILHETCRQPNGAAYQRAWYELDSWLRRQWRALPRQPQEQDEALQETLSALQIQLEKNSLKAPRAFLVYALQTMRRTVIDLERKKTAVSRGGDQEIASWEELHEDGPDQPAAPIQPEAAVPGAFERRVEHAVSEREVRAKLKIFFSRHLKSDQQVLVAELLFLDGLHPKEVGELLHKEPHQIRMIKSRIVQTLRSLPPAEQQELLTLLDRANVEEPDES
ncbi:MAG: sigma-70 family RNA polymerase sigma factor [bacterium]|nr:sigma-70 family RNA polymerase sigma factor [bacterium]